MCGIMYYNHQLLFHISLQLIWTKTWFTDAVKLMLLVVFIKERKQGEDKDPIFYLVVSYHHLLFDEDMKKLKRFDDEKRKYDHLIHVFLFYFFVNSQFCFFYLLVHLWSPLNFRDFISGFGNFVSAFLLLWDF